jgi:hypothetical protein
VQVQRQTSAHVPVLRDAGERTQRGPSLQKKSSDGGGRRGGRGITTFKIGIFLLPCTEKMNDGGCWKRRSLRGLKTRGRGCRGVQRGRGYGTFITCYVPYISGSITSIGCFRKQACILGEAPINGVDRGLRRTPASSDRRTVMVVYVGEQRNVQTFSIDEALYQAGRSSICCLLHPDRPRGPRPYL